MVLDSSFFHEADAMRTGTSRQNFTLQSKVVISWLTRLDIPIDIGVVPVTYGILESDFLQS